MMGYSTDNPRESGGLLPGNSIVTEACDWHVCVSNMTDTQWDECLKYRTANYDAPTNTSGPKYNPGTNYSFNCISFAESEAKAASKSGPQRAVVGGVVFAMACAALAVAI